jgi:hypothetical protein
MIPTDESRQLARLREQQSVLERDLADFGTGTGSWRVTPVGDAHNELLRARTAHHEALRRADAPRHRLLGGRRARREVEATLLAVQERERAWQVESEPHARYLREQQADLAREVRRLESTERARAEFTNGHPDVIERIAEIGRAIAIVRAVERRRRDAGRVESPTMGRRAWLWSELPDTRSHAPPPSGPDI